MRTILILLFSLVVGIAYSAPDSEEIPKKLTSRLAAIIPGMSPKEVFELFPRVTDSTELMTEYDYKGVAVVERYWKIHAIDGTFAIVIPFADPDSSGRKIVDGQPFIFRHNNAFTTVRKSRSVNTDGNKEFERKLAESRAKLHQPKPGAGKPKAEAEGKKPAK